MRIRQEEESSTGTMLASLTLGVLAGFAVGVLVAQKSGGVSGLAARLRRRLEEIEEEEAAGPEEEEEAGEEEEEEEEELAAELPENDELVEEEEEDRVAAADAALESHVLEAFRGDPVLRERAIDIGAVGDGVIELSGWVDSDDESELAENTARRVSGVDSVVNRIMVGRADEVEVVEEEEVEPRREHRGRRGNAGWHERPRA